MVRIRQFWWNRADGSGSVTKSTELVFDGGEAFELQVKDEEIYAADQLGVFRMAVLVDQYEGLLAAADFCDGLIELAEAKMMVKIFGKHSVDFWA